MRITLQMSDPKFRGRVLNEPQLLEQIGRELADSQQARIRSGRDADGNAIPAPKDGGQPFNRTGFFIDKIKMRKQRNGVVLVGPTGIRPGLSRRDAAFGRKGTSIGGRRRGRERGALVRSNRDLARLYAVRKFWHPSGQNIQLIGATSDDLTRSENIAREKIEIELTNEAGR